MSVWDEVAAVGQFFVIFRKKIAILMLFESQFVHVAIVDTWLEYNF